MINVRLDEDIVIPSETQLSRGIWPANVWAFPSETGFLRYMMLCITPVGMTKCNP